jgi:hypothetical protein
VLKASIVKVHLAVLVSITYFFQNDFYSCICFTGASAANSQSQGLNCGYSGCSGSLGFSGSQSYNFPGGRNFAFSLGRGVR